MSEQDISQAVFDAVKTGSNDNKKSPPGYKVWSDLTETQLVLASRPNHGLASQGKNYIELQFTLLKHTKCN